MPVKIGQSLSLDPFKAVVELHNEIYDPAAELILFFCSSHYDLHDLAKQINHLFSGITVIGCTSAETVVKAFRPPDAIKYSHAKPQEISLERRID
jgi:hypothetical protein